MSREGVRGQGSGIRGWGAERSGSGFMLATATGDCLLPTADLCPLSPNPCPSLDQIKQLRGAGVVDALKDPILLEGTIPVSHRDERDTKVVVS
jgi:hypothetical protein